jgi:hypothetical protein
MAAIGPWLKPPWPTGGSVYWGAAGMGSTLSAGRAQCKPADRYDCYGALRQVETIAGPGGRRYNGPAPWAGIAWRRSGRCTDPWRCGGNMHKFFDGAKQSPILAREF